MTDDGATGPPAATMADWLELHGISGASLTGWIATVGERPRRSPDPPLAPGPHAEVVLGALGQVLPGLSQLLDRARAEVRFDLAPDRVRFPRAFTIDDPGDGRPFVSCPCTGRTSDLLGLAHETGHALQALAVQPAPLPPIQREMAAFIAEDAATRGLRSQHPALGPLLVARGARVTRHAPGLRAALASPSSAYSYAWNYPVARSLASRATATLPPDELVALITAPGALGPLMARLG